MSSYVKACIGQHLGKIGTKRKDMKLVGSRADLAVRVSATETQDPVSTAEPTDVVQGVWKKSLPEKS